MLNLLVPTSWLFKILEYICGVGIVNITKESNLPKYRQIVASIEAAVGSGALKKGDKLPSLNSIKNQHSLSRDTVLMAFNELKTRGIIQSIVGKGYYVSSEDVQVTQKIFLLFDEFNSFKEDLYNSFLNSLGPTVQVDLFFHHFNPEMFRKLISDSAGNYSFYVLMPANLPETKKSIEQLPVDKVYILDQKYVSLSEYPAVFQNFEKNIIEGLQNVLLLLLKYTKIFLVFPPEKQPIGIRKGFELFCTQNNMASEVIATIAERKPQKGEVYIVLDDRSLLQIVKKISEENWVLAKDFGVIAYNDTLLKEIVAGGITTISTDFNAMGARLAQMIIANEKGQVENPNRLIIRKSI